MLLLTYLFLAGSANRGDSLDRIIDDENSSTKDFLILVGVRTLLVTF